MPIQVNHVLYATPFAKLFREHSPIEMRDMVDSVRVLWVRVPVLVYESPVHGPSLIDGIGRSTAALTVDENREVPVRSYGRITDAEAEALARHLNEVRRHLTADELRKAHTDRLRQAAEMRKNGTPYHKISIALDMPVATVYSALNPPEKSTVQKRTSTILIDDEDVEELDEELDAETEEEFEEELPDPQESAKVESRASIPTKAPVVVAKIRPDLELNTALDTLAKLRKHMTGARACLADLATGPLKGKVKRLDGLVSAAETELEAVKA